jgi:nucleoside-diphosphate-sugar epimerase
MKFFVTGGTGFIGGHFLRAALGAGHEVLASRRPGSVCKIPLQVEPSWVDCDLGDLAGHAQRQFRGCNALIHFAAAGVQFGSAQETSWQEMFTVNVMQSLTVWQTAIDAGVQRLVICGSCFEYGASGLRFGSIPIIAPLEPTNAYAASKAAATMAAVALAREKKAECALLRPFHVFGEGEAATRFWPALREAAMTGRDFAMSAGEQVRDFVPVEKVAEAFLHTAVHVRLTPGVPKIRNLGSGRAQTLLQFAQEWWRKWEAKGNLLVGELPYRPNEVMRYVPQLQETG